MAAARVLRREWPFTLRIPASEAAPGAPADRGLLVQGVMDACFIEEDAWVLIDYKTDRVIEKSLAEAAQKHAPQLEMYARALETLTGKPVKEQYVVLLRKHTAVQLD